MLGFCRVHEKRRRTRGSQGGRNLATDVTTLAHAHDDDTPLHAQHQFHGPRELAIDVGAQAQDGLGFDL